MSNTALGEFLVNLRKACATQAARHVSDDILLNRFVTEREDAAFSVLVQRHGPLVLGLAQRMLGDVHAAEDCFQATFLVLSRRAGSIRPKEPLSNWLYGVARRIALRISGQRAQRQYHERQTVNLPQSEPPGPLDELTWQELRSVLDDEIGRLPDKYRAPIVLCYLQGKSFDKAAQELGCAKGSLARRLGRSCELLRHQLVRRGFALSAAALLTALSEKATAARVGALLAIHTAKAALSIAKGKAVATGWLSIRAVALAQEVSKGMVAIKGKVVVLVLALGFAVGGVGLAGYGGLAWRGTNGTAPNGASSANKAVPRQNRDNALKTEQGDRVVPLTDLYGDPLPEGAVARLGTTRLRHGSAVGWLQFTSDGKGLASQGGDGVSIWNASTGRQFRFFANDSQDGKQILYESTPSKDGKLLAMAGKSEVHIYEVADGKRVQTIETGAVRLPRFSPDGKILAVQSDKKPWPFELWEVASGKQLFSARGDESYFACLEFTPDGKKLVTAGSNYNFSPPRDDHRICFWDAATGKELRQILMGTANAKNLVFSPDGKLMAMSCYGNRGTENCIRIWDVAEGKEVRQLVPSVKDSRQAFSSAVTFSPDGKTVYTGGVDGKLIAWDPFTGMELRRLGTGFLVPKTLAVSPDGRTLAVGTSWTAIRLIDAQSGQDTLPVGGHATSILYASVSPDGRTIATGDPYHIFGWDAKTGTELYRLETDWATMLGGPIDNGRAFFTMDWGWGVSARESQQSLSMRDLQTGKEIRRTDWQIKKDTAFNLLAVAPDGKTMAIHYHNTSALILVDAATGKQMRKFEKLDQGNFLRGAAFAPDGRSVVVWGPDDRIRHWDVADGQLLREFPALLEGGESKFMEPYGPKLSVGHAAVSPDFSLIAVSKMRSDFIAIHDLTTGKLVRRLDALPDAVETLAFSPDSKTLAWGGSFDGCVRLAEVATGRQRQAFMGHKGGVLSLAFSGDGKILVSGGSDTAALVWDLTGLHGAKTPLAKKLTPAQLATCWADLAGEDSAKAYQIMRSLAAAPADAIPYLGSKVSPVPAVDDKRVARLVMDLGNEAFAVRQAATKELEEIGDVAEGALQRIVSGKPSLELKRRAELLLEKLAQAWHQPGPINLRILRTLEILELAGTLEARAVLERLAGGAPGARLTRQATASLQRLSALSQGD